VLATPTLLNLACTTPIPANASDNGAGTDNNANGDTEADNETGGGTEFDAGNANSSGNNGNDNNANGNNRNDNTDSENNDNEIVIGDGDDSDPDSGVGSGSGNGDDSGGNPLSMTDDSDGDGFSNFEEYNNLPGSDPFNAEDTPLNPIDTDGDGCSDFDEITFAGFCNNDPNTPGEGGTGTSGGGGSTGGGSGGATVTDPDASFSYDLTIARHVDEPYTESQVDSNLDKAGELLQLRHNGCDDVEADTTFARSGALDTFDIGATVVTSESELTQLFNLNYDIKVVNLIIGACGITDPNDMTIVVGCATSGGTMVITTVADPDVWAHEWGHVQGLPHRDACPRNLMHSFEVNTNAVNETERSAFLTATPGFGRILPKRSKSFTQALYRADGESLDAWRVRVFDKRYLAGVPADVALAMGADAKAHLRNKLPDAPCHVRCNMIRALGLVGDASIVPQLLSNVLEPVGALGVDEYIEIVESLFALGRLVPHDATGAARALLIDGANPAYWQHGAIGWTYASLIGERRAENLAAICVKSLALSDDPATAKRLKQIADTPRAAFAKHASESLALKALKHGAAEHSEEPQPRRFR
jgi:hypothetical protein